MTNHHYEDWCCIDSNDLVLKSRGLMTNQKLLKNDEKMTMMMTMTTNDDDDDKYHH